MKRFVAQPLKSALYAIGLLGVSTQTFASAFQLWEQDGASVSNYHAGYAVYPYNANAIFYNPAEITFFNNSQISVGGTAILPDFKYKGSVTIIEGPATQPFGQVTTQGGTFNFVPNAGFVTPINERMGFGVTLNVPFGLKTNYGRSTPLRYAATLTSIQVIDLSPALGIQINEKASAGVGLDIQRARAEFNSTATSLLIPDPEVIAASDTTSTNTANSTGYGMHVGALYKFTPNTHVGISYHSQVQHHFRGTSKFEGPIADNMPSGPMITSSRAKTNITLPAYTALSIYQRLHPQVALMATAIYTQWSVIKDLKLEGLTGVVLDPFFMPSNNITVILPQYYRNTWNLSVGADYYATSQITLRGAVGYDQTPVKNAYRNVQLPDNNRYVLALGGHYQATKALGFDLGWAHVFADQAKINPAPQTMGAQTLITSGHASGGADVLSGQITWDFV